MILICHSSHFAYICIHLKIAPVAMNPLLKWLFCYKSTPSFLFALIYLRHPSILYTYFCILKY